MGLGARVSIVKHFSKSRNLQKKLYCGGGGPRGSEFFFLQRIQIYFFCGGMGRRGEWEAKVGDFLQSIHI